MLRSRRESCGRCHKLPTTSSCAYLPRAGDTDWMSAVESAEALSSGVDMLVFPWAKAGAPNARDTSVAASSFIESFSPLRLASTRGAKARITACREAHDR